MCVCLCLCTCAVCANAVCVYDDFHFLHTSGLCIIHVSMCSTVCTVHVCVEGVHTVHVKLLGILCVCTYMYVRLCVLVRVHAKSLFP